MKIMFHQKKKSHVSFRKLYYLHLYTSYLLLYIIYYLRCPHSSRLMVEFAGKISASARGVEIFLR